MILIFEAVQTLPILLDTSKTIRLIFCALYKQSEPERQAEAEATRQRRSGNKTMFLPFCLVNEISFFKAYCSRKCLPNKQRLMNTNIPSTIQEKKQLETINQSQMTKSSVAIPVMNESDQKSVQQLTIDSQYNKVFYFLDQK